MPHPSGIEVPSKAELHMGLHDLIVKLESRYAVLLAAMKVVEQTASTLIEDCDKLTNAGAATAGAASVFRRIASEAIAKVNQ